MICDRCKKNPATFHSTVNINGHFTEQHLCSECATSAQHFTLSSVFSPIFNDMFLDSRELTCPKCGYTLSEFKSTGLLGCDKCYDTFRDIIMSNLRSIQPGLTHTGRQLEDNNLSETEQKIRKLEIQLKSAVAEENYEQASVLKKEIDKLKEDSNGQQ